MPITIPPNRKITIEPKQGGGYQSAGLPDGLPPGALTMGTTTKTATSITGVVTDGNGSTSYQIRVNGGTWQSGLTATGLTAETTYSVEWRGVNANGTGPATTPENVTTSAAGSWVEGQPPAPSGVTGTFSQGNQLTISGSNFSANRSGQYFYKSFDGGTAGQDAVSEFQKAANTYLYSATDAPSNKTTCARYSVAQQAMASTRLLTDVGGWDSAWMHCDVRIETPDNDSGGDEQVKMFRFVSGTGDTHLPTPHLGWVWEMSQSWMQTWFSAYQGETVMGMNPGSKAAVPGVWRRWTLGWKASTPDVSDGYALAKNSETDDPDNSSSQFFNDPAKLYNDKSWKTSPRITVKSGDTGTKIEQLFLPFYHRSDQSTVISLSNLWVNDSPEQVLLGDAATLETCTTSKLVNQPMVSRDNGAIVVTSEEGPNGELATGPVYAFIFNKDGVYNETGIQVRA